MGAEQVADQITWGELGCPKAIGSYRLHGESVRVKNIHIIVAEGDPRAIFTVVAFRPPLGPLGYNAGPPRRRSLCSIRLRTSQHERHQSRFDRSESAWGRAG